MVVLRELAQQVILSPWRALTGSSAYVLVPLSICFEVFFSCAFSLVLRCSLNENELKIFVSLSVLSDRLLCRAKVIRLISLVDCLNIYIYSMAQIRLIIRNI